MKFKYILTALVIIISSLAFGVVHADGLEATLYGNVNSDVNTNVKINGNANMESNQHGENAHATSSVYIKATSSEENDENTSATSDSEEENGMADEHRSVVANFVHSLLQVADQEDGIGAEVRAVAHTEDESATTTESAMVKVDKKGPVATFFFGSDYKNLGVIRSELATTTKDIARLQALLASTTNDTDRATLSAQIQVLQAEQVKVDAYVTAHENTFSLFGWFTKLFSK